MASRTGNPGVLIRVQDAGTGDRGKMAWRPEVRYHAVHYLRMFTGPASRMWTRSSVAISTSAPRRRPLTLIRSRAGSDS